MMYVDKFLVIQDAPMQKDRFLHYAKNVVRRFMTETIISKSMVRIIAKIVSTTELRRCVMNSYVHTCPVCKEKFLPAPQHIYRKTPNSKTLVCTYSCMLKYRKEVERKKREKMQAKKGLEK